jgi:hypothetical protein
LNKIYEDGKKKKIDDGLVKEEEKEELEREET